MTKEQYKTNSKTWLLWVRDLAVMAVLIFAARSAIADWNYVPTGSMKPTILEGDMIFVNRLAYDLKVPFTTRHLAVWGQPKRGEIVVFYSPVDGDRLVKRVVGLPGDTVAMRENVLYLNGKHLNYTALDSRVINTLSQQDRITHFFADENLAGTIHPIMIAPGNPPSASFGPITVPAGKYLMLGDNRDNSADSRYIGLIDRAVIVGRATTVIASWDRDKNYFPRKQRFFVSLP